MTVLMMYLQLMFIILGTPLFLLVLHRFFVIFFDFDFVAAYLKAIDRVFE